jgi:hypothetical protein
MLNKERQEQRLREWKKGTDLEESRRKREESTIRIRKNKREENLQKRRNIPLNSAPAYMMDTTIAERVSCFFLNLSIFHFVFYALSFSNRYLTIILSF